MPCAVTANLVYMVVGVGFIVTGHASQDGVPDRLPVAAYVEAYRAFDTARNDGHGYADATDASQLGWGESYVLLDYVYLWRVTGDPSWLHKVRDHADAVFASMCDHDGDGYAGWQTDRYSVALAEVSFAGDGLGALDVQERIADIASAHAVTGHTYELRFDGNGAYGVTDTTTGVVEAHPAPGSSVAGVPGVQMKLSAKPRPGDTYTIRTTAVEPLEYLIHEGMLLAPVALFIEAVWDGDPALRAAAARYVALIRDNFVPKWEPYWTDLSGGSGAYTATNSPAERTPGRLLPHNQYAMHAQTYAVLDTFLPSLRLGDRARRMSRNFRANLRMAGDAYVWNYWDWDGGSSGPEDTSHAAINVGLVIEGARRGVEFRDADAARIARTLLDVMWNGSLTDPSVGDRVDTSEGDTYFTLRRWAELCAYDPQVWDVCLAMFCKRGEKPSDIPTMLHAQKGLTHE